MTTTDAIWGPFFFLLLLGMGLVLRRFLTTPLTKRYFLPAMLIKLLGALAFGVIYQFYYGGGDTFNYHQTGQRIVGAAFEESVSMGVEVMMLDAGQYEGASVRYTTRGRFFNSPEEWMLTKISGIIGVFTFSSYLAIAFCFAYFAFLGTWRLFSVMVLRYPHLHLPLAFAVFGIPTLVFWASGLMKDTITLGALGFLAGAIIALAGGHSTRPVRDWALIALGGYLLLGLKPYILYTFLPPIFYWLFLRFKNNIRAAIIRVVVVPIMIVGFGVFGLLLFRVLAASNPEYADLEEVTHRIQDFHGDHSKRAGGSVYTLGEVDYSPLGMLKKVPASIVVTFYRPFLWEVNNVVMLITAVESLFFLLLTFYILLKVRVLNGLKSFGNPDFILCIAFALLLGYVVGFISYNFGALARFKVPALPFFAIALLLLVDSTRKRPQEGRNGQPAAPARTRRKVLTWASAEEP